MKIKTVICQRCGKEFSYEVNVLWRPNRKYCSLECRYPQNIVKCITCGKTFHRNISHMNRTPNIFCSSKCHYEWEVGKKSEQVGTGKNSHKWKGGRKLNSEGYYEIYNLNHPNAKKQSGQSAYIMEHRLIAEKCLGRFLTKDEVIHHIDFSKTNNEPKNLYLFYTGGEHTAYHHSFNRGEAIPLISNLGGFKNE